MLSTIRILVYAAMVLYPANVQSLALDSQEAISLDQIEMTKNEQVELAVWLGQIKKLQDFRKEWDNKVAHRLSGGFKHVRVSQPVQPAWLDAKCAQISRQALWYRSEARPKDNTSNPLAAACLILADLSKDVAAEAIDIQTHKIRSDKEKLEKSSFLSRLLVDGLWTTPETGSVNRVNGLFGIHFIITDLGRVQISSPGLMAVTRLDTHGRRELRMASTLGLSYALKDFKFRGKPMTMYVNITKCKILGGGAVETFVSQTQSDTLAGFSIAKRRK